VVKLTTIRMVLSLTISCSWLVHQLDVKNSFLHGTLSETVYCSRPMGFVDLTQPDRVCRLNKSLYGLKQAPQVSYSRFTTYLLTLGFVETKSTRMRTRRAVWAHADPPRAMLCSSVPT
jgi:hypothetical protein